MVQWLRVLADLLEDPGSVPSTHIGHLRLPKTPVPWTLLLASSGSFMHMMDV